MAMKHFNHIGLTVTDIERSRGFYTGVLGFRYDRELRMTADQLGLLQLDPPSDIHAVYLMLDSITLELMQFTGATPAAGSRVFNQTGLAHLSIAVEDIPEVLARVEEFGGTVVSDVGFAAIIRDPDGQLIELLTTGFYDDVEADRRARQRGEG
jgi:lactoylglutathione lyase